MSWYHVYVSSNCVFSGDSYIEALKEYRDCTIDYPDEPVYLTEINDDNIKYLESINFDIL